MKTPTEQFGDLIKDAKKNLDGAFAAYAGGEDEIVAISLLKSARANIANAIGLVKQEG